MRYDIGRYVVMVMIMLGVCGGAVMGMGAQHASVPASATQGLSWGEGITLGQWGAERASEAQEDEDAWDCRVMGDTQCGDTWYELVCPDAPQVPTLLCSLEPHKARAVRYV